MIVELLYGPVVTLWINGVRPANKGWTVGEPRQHEVGVVTPVSESDGSPLNVNGFQITGVLHDAPIMMDGPLPTTIGLVFANERWLAWRVTESDMCRLIDGEALVQLANGDDLTIDYEAVYLSNR